MVEDHHPGWRRTLAQGLRGIGVVAAVTAALVVVALALAVVVTLVTP